MRVSVVGVGELSGHVFTVIVAFDATGRLVLCRHRDRSTWETPGGHIEPGESVIEAAARELFEETGILAGDLVAIGDYEVDGTAGRLFVADIGSQSELPTFEIAQTMLVAELPDDLTYPQITPVLVAAATEWWTRRRTQRTAARAQSFGPHAEAYDRLRPGYPEALFDDVLRYAGAVTSAALEIGAGTGKATLRLLERGLDVVAVEPSEPMAEVLRERAAGAGPTGHLTIRPGTFEEFVPARPFGLVVAAQSFHWVEPSTRWRRLSDVLAPGGAAALFWNAWQLDPSAHDHAAVRRVFDASGPDLRPDVVPFVVDDRPPDGLSAVPELVDFEVRRYDRAWILDTADYLSLLATTSQFAVLDDEHRARILQPLGRILGRRTHLLVRTELMLLRRDR